MAGHTRLKDSDWSVAANWSGGALPDNTDYASIGEGLNAAVNAGLDQGGKDPDLIRVHELYSHDIGSSGTPLKIACDKLEHYGRGGLYYQCDANATALKTDDVLIQCADASVVTQLSSGAGTDAGDFDQIVLNRGTVRMTGDIEFGASCTLIVGMVSRSTDVNFTIASGADTLPTLHMNAGRGSSEGAITTAFIMGGIFTQANVAAITTLYIGPGAVVNYNYSAATTVVVFAGGTLNLLDNTIGKTITTLWSEPGSTVLYDDVLHTITTHKDFRRALP